MTPKLQGRSDDDVLLGLRFITNLDGEVTSTPSTLLVLEEERKRYERRARIEKMIAALMVIALLAFAAWTMSYAIENDATDLPTKADAQTWKTP
jgi:hypothetical protein